MDIDLRQLKLTVQPHVIAGLLSLDDDSDMSFGKLDHLIRADQNMTTLILKAANSSLYSRGNEIRTLQHAIAMLGFHVVRSLAMVATSQELFKAGNYARFKRLVWEHSIVTAITARDVANRSGHQDLAEEAFIAGLLHDIGKVLLTTIDRKKFIQALDIVQEGKKTYREAEDQIFATNHLALGQKAAEQWKLPVVFTPSLAEHDNAERIQGANLEETSDQLLCIVAYANYLAKKNSYGLFIEKEEAVGAAAGAKLPIEQKYRQYFTEGYGKIIERDEFYKFFMSLV